MHCLDYVAYHTDLAGLSLCDAKRGDKFVNVYLVLFHNDPCIVSSMSRITQTLWDSHYATPKGLTYLSMFIWFCSTMTHALSRVCRVSHKPCGTLIMGRQHPVPLIYIYLFYTGLLIWTTNNPEVENHRVPCRAPLFVPDGTHVASLM